MNKKEILNHIKQHFQPLEQFTAQEFSEKIHLSRSMTSNYLNQLVKQKELQKRNTRPVGFFLPMPSDTFTKIIGHDGSMSQIIEQCKAAVNYPPKGLPLIIRGNSGVGKSMLAEKIYNYAKEKQVIKERAPFVTLNCADYANNPELLSSTLFGYVKGAFTGAIEEKKGLLDNADGGYLFLDEVHNLSQENQEKLFILIDQHKFRRLGAENQWHHADIRLLLATTEDTENRLLATFRRRIPLEITLPDFKDRSQQERWALIGEFFQKEAHRMKKEIFVQPTLLEDLIYADFEGNIGAVQNQIQISCAKAYNGQASQSAIYIPNYDEGPWIKATDLESYDLDATHLKERVRNYFNNCSRVELENNVLAFLQDLKSHKDDNELSYIGEQFVYSKLKTNLDCLAHFGKRFTDVHLKDLSLLISTLENIEHFNILEAERKEDMKYATLAQSILEIVQPAVDNYFLKSILMAYVKKRLPIQSEKNAFIVMHGKQSASSLASEANNLIGDYIFEAFDMPIQVETKEIVRRVNDYVTHIDTREGLLLLVDMGSLEKMYEEIKENVSGDLLIVNNVSTALMIHIGFALLQNKPMDYFTEMDYQQFNVKPQYFEGISQSQNIIISCMSGEGISQKIKEIFLSVAPKIPVEILVIEFDELEKIIQKGKYSSFKNTLAVISTTRIMIPGVQCLNIENIVNGSHSLEMLDMLYTEEEIRQHTNELIKLFTIEGASARLRFLNPDMIINEIEDIISLLEERYKVTFKNFIRVNLFLHLSSMIERILVGDSVNEMDNSVSAELAEFIEVADEIFAFVRKKYNIEIPPKEYDYVYRIIQA
uniref:sigma 54-interacting transcriptional regulator n=1 Tax=Candidatus Enterococcus willemsii TaxID=1857215 RepID=UPI00403F8698